MDDSSKILSVSYGNFSCHLEGFDDSVEVMKTVVSYFHELAGHERFMDMEPQAPDMDTLARLTEDQTGGVIEAEGEGNSVSMRMIPEAAADAVDEAEEFVEDVIAEDELSDGADTIVLKKEDDVETAETIAEEAPTADVADFPIDEDSVAAKLQRIRAVVDRPAGEAAPAETAEDDANAFTEDLAEDDGPAVETAAPGNPLAKRLAELAARKAEDAAHEAGIALDDEDDYDDDLSEEELAELDAEFAAEEAEDVPVSEAPAAEDTSGPLELTEEDQIVEDSFADEAPLEAADPVAEPEVIEDTGPLVLTGASNSDDDDDFDLQDDIAEAQREIAEKDKRNDLRDTVDANMTRILSQTDEHLAEPEGRRHRDAFAQLKAAVAATEAARQLGDSGATERDKNEVFRDDLGALDAEEAQEKAETPAEEPIVEDTAADDVAEEPAAADEPVIAEEPAPAAPEIEEPVAVEKPAPAPLKLVSSQAANTSDAASDRLRQIAAAKDAGPVTKDGFAEFAASHSATELTDLLEAAAAYICIVQGEDDFSRPQVMKKVQSASAKEFSREDGLRAFGKLLRLNRLAKLENGRFRVAPDTRFVPEGKAAQG
ncbi:hypothetical protein [Yoonia sp. BS5-3]|uniref:Lipoprotein n=1 Tax=Yoonia phaeophyticola TaxID=3137369 RepID=A0ABZ3IDS8_9RHOB